MPVSNETAYTTSLRDALDMHDNQAGTDADQARQQALCGKTMKSRRRVDSESRHSLFLRYFPANFSPNRYMGTKVCRNN